MTTNLRRYAAEAIGTFVLVFAGCGSAVLAGDKIGYVGISLAFGLALLAMVYAVGPVSGCHLNPAVTLGLWMTRKFQSKYVAGYVIFQLVGALLATTVLLAIAKGMAGGYDPATSGFASNGYGAHSPGHFGVFAAFLTEAVLTALLVFTVLNVTDVRAPAGFAGIAIGLVLVLIHLVSIPVTNTSVNPVRSIAPAVFAGGWALSQLWLFVLAPLAGALIAAGAYALLHAPGDSLHDERSVRFLEVEQAQRREVEIHAMLERIAALPVETRNF
jgi:aquaporin Z